MSQLPRTSSLSFPWDVAPPGSWICSQAHPAHLGGSWGIWVDFTSSYFSSSARGGFYTLEWFLALPDREPWKCQGLELGWAEPPPAKL